MEMSFKILLKKQFHRHICRILALSLIIATGLEGCSLESAPLTEQETYEDITGLSLTPMVSSGYEIAYTRTAVTSSIFVNPTGYDAQSEKKVYFISRDLGQTFTVCRAGTEDAVYVGQIGDPKTDTTTQQEICAGDFSSFKTPGTYIIKTDYLGESREFTIVTDMSDSLLLENFESFLADFSAMKEQKGEALEASFEDLACRMVAYLLSYSLFTNHFDDATLERFSGNNAPDVLDVCMQVTDWLLETESGLSDESGLGGNAELLAAGVLARFARAFNKYDSSYCNRCKKLAEKYYKAVRKSDKEPDSEILFYTATELYHLTGTATYRDQALQLYGTDGIAVDGSFLSFAGCVSYMMGKKSTDLDTCNEIMKTIMKHANQIIYHYGNDYFGVANRDLNEAIAEIQNILVANYVLDSGEYDAIIEDYTTYLQGLNAEGLALEPTGEDVYRYILLLCERAGRNES